MLGQDHLHCLWLSLIIQNFYCIFGVLFHQDIGQLNKVKHLKISDEISSFPASQYFSHLSQKSSQAELFSTYLQKYCSRLSWVKLGLFYLILPNYKITTFILLNIRMSKKKFSVKKDLRQGDGHRSRLHKLELRGGVYVSNIPKG